jgi:hypothetical protein
MKLRCVFLLALWSWTLPAGAEEVFALAAIPIIVSEGTAPLSTSVLTEDVARAARGRPGLRALSSEELFVSARAELIDEVRGCGADESCMSERLSSVDAGLGVIVLVSFVVEPPLVAVRLVDVKEKKVVASAIGPVEESEKSISGAVQTRVGKILEARGFLLEQKAAPNLLPPPIVEETSIFQSPWVWVAAGIVVVAGASIAIVASTNQGSCVCVGPPGSCPEC